MIGIGFALIFAMMCDVGAAPPHHLSLDSRGPNRANFPCMPGDFVEAGQRYAFFAVGLAFATSGIQPLVLVDDQRRVQPQSKVSTLRKAAPARSLSESTGSPG